jgi:hypothetical protein
LGVKEAWDDLDLDPGFTAGTIRHDRLASAKLATTLDADGNALKQGNDHQVSFTFDQGQRFYLGLSSAPVPAQASGEPITFDPSVAESLAGWLIGGSGLTVIVPYEVDVEFTPTGNRSDVPESGSLLGLLAVAGLGCWVKRQNTRLQG